MHLNITGSVTLSQIFVRGVRGSTDSLVYIMLVVMQLSERLEICTGCTLSIVIWKSKIIFSKKLCKEGLISIIMHN